MHTALLIEVLNFLGANINYGGRVTDDKDKLLISTILKSYIHSDAVSKGSGHLRLQRLQVQPF
eukprot:6458937-Amphidinium_carterae.1